MSPGTHFLIVSLIYVLAVMRLVRLINGDTIFDRFRAIPMNKAHAAREAANAARRRGAPELVPGLEAQAHRWSTILYFIECPWCVGMWAAFGTAWLAIYFNDNPVVQYVGIALATSHLVGVFAFAADTEEVDVEEQDG